MRVRYIGLEPPGGYLLPGKVYEAPCIKGHMIGIIDETGESYCYLNDERVWEIVEPLPLPEVKEQKLVTIEQAMQEHPECFPEGWSPS